VGDVQKLQSLLVGATASDASDPEPEGEQPRVGAQVVDATTVLQVGRQRLSFDFTDASGNTGSAESEILVLAPVPGAPAVPTMAASVTGTLVSASWGPGVGGGAPTRYRVRVSSAPARADVAVLDVGGLRSGEGHLAPGIYYLSAEAINAAGTAVSDEVRVYVGGPPPPPPTLNAVVDGQQVALRWQPGPGAFTLQVGSQVGASDIATLPLGAQTDISGTLPPGTYFARLIASSGTGSATSNEVVLQTSCAPPPPPALTASVAGGRVALTWTPVRGAVRYQLQAGSSPTLSNLVDLDVGAGLAIDAAAPRGTYYVRLIAVGACGASAPSPETTVVVP